MSGPGFGPQEAYALLSGNSDSEVVAFRPPSEDMSVTLGKATGGRQAVGASREEIQEGRMEEAALELGPEWWRDACHSGSWVGKSTYAYNSV